MIDEAKLNAWTAARRTHRETIRAILNSDNGEAARREQVKADAAAIVKAFHPGRLRRIFGRTDMADDIRDAVLAIMDQASP